MRRLAILAALPLLTLVSASADALTVRDVVELTRAGLGDEILLALIDVDRSVFPIDTATLKRLKDAGVSERVIVAMIRSARTPEPQPVAVSEPVPVAAPEPQVVVIEHHDAPQVREVPVAVPVYIPVRVRSSEHRAVEHAFESESRIDRRDRAADHHEPAKRAEPVYWGFGGKLRPDAWQPTPDTTPRKKQ